MNKYLESILIFTFSTVVLYGALYFIIFVMRRGKTQLPDAHLVLLDVSMKWAAFVAFYNLLRRILLPDDEVNANEN